MKIRFPILKISFLFCFSFALSVAQAQWNDNGTNIRTDDNVGIGVSSNTYSLFVRKNKEAWQGRFMNRGGVGADVYLAHGAGYGMFIRGRTADTKYTLQLNNINGATNIFRNNGVVGLGLAGKVGIGTVSPTHQLTVMGDAKVNGVLSADFVNAPNGTSHFTFNTLDDHDGDSGTNDEENPIFKLSANHSPFDVLTVIKNGNIDLEAVPSGNTPGAKFTLNGSGGIVLEARNNQNIALRGASDILIQNNNGSGNIKMTPTDFACVEGRLEIRGSGTCGAPDYVFAEDYELRSIEELAAYIEKENHLPGVKSAEAFVSSGFDVVADSYSILEKVEELALYTIDQQNHIANLKEELKMQQSQTAELKALVEKLLQK